MTDDELLDRARKAIRKARNSAIQFTVLANSFSSDMDRSSKQLKSDLQQGFGRLRGGVVVPRSYLDEILWVDNYEMIYIDSLKELVIDFLDARSPNGRKLALRPIIESVYHYSEASLSPMEGVNAKRIERFRYLQVLYFKLFMARYVGHRWVDDYINYLKVAQKHLPTQKLKIFPSDLGGVRDEMTFKDQNIIRCIEQVALKIGSSVTEPNYFKIVWSDMSLLAHGNPWGVSISSVRKKQKREDCLLLSILLAALGELAKVMMNCEEINPELRVNLEKFSIKNKVDYSNEMRLIWQELSVRQI